jgi:hypothetical protein
MSGLACPGPLYSRDRVIGRDGTDRRTSEAPASGESSIFALCSPLLEAESHIPIRGRNIKGRPFDVGFDRWHQHLRKGAPSC